MYKTISTAFAAVLFSSSVAVASAKPASCAVADRPAVVVRWEPVQPPAIAQFEKLTETSVIQVDLSETGALEGAYVAASSGSAILDRAAIRALQSIVFAPETRSCKPVSGSYAVEVEFDD